MVPVALFGIFEDALDALNAVVCLIENLAYAFAWAICTVLNFVIKALGAVIVALLSVLPSMPDLPTSPSNGVVQFLAWVVPIGSIVATAVAWLTVYAIFLAYRVLAKWMRAL